LIRLSQIGTSMNFLKTLGSIKTKIADVIHKLNFSANLHICHRTLFTHW